MVSVLISASTFTGNGYFDNADNQYYSDGLNVISRGTHVYFRLTIRLWRNIFRQFSLLTVSENTGKDVWFSFLTVPINLDKRSNTTLILSNSSFANNKDGGLVCNNISHNDGLMW